MFAVALVCKTRIKNVNNRMCNHIIINAEANRIVK